MDSRDDLLAGAVDIAHKLMATALWDGGRCTWLVTQTHRDNPTAAGVTYVPAGGALYKGSSGIGLFFLELSSTTGQAEYRRFSDGALRHALGYTARQELRLPSFHSGGVGIAYVAARHGRLTNSDEFLSAAQGIVAALPGQERTDTVLDVIGGAAGAIPALLRIAAWLDLPAANDVAVAMGEHLIRSAHRRTVGWSWGGTKPGSADHLTGFAHGAAGCGAALMELYAMTGADRFRYAAEQAFIYESRWFDAASGNWFDLRNGETQRLGSGPQPFGDALRQTGNAARWSPKSMSAWCHGAPGIGLARLRAFEVTGDERWLREAEIAVSTTARDVFARRTAGSYCLCHGILGNAETLLMADRVLGQQRWQNPVVDAARRGLYSQGRSGWRSGIFGMPDASLLLGDAGIGHALLRLADPHVPSVLLITDGGKPAELTGSQETWTLRREHVDTFFGDTLTAWSRMGIALSTEGGPPVDPRDARHLVERTLRSHVGTPDLVADSCAVDIARYDLADEIRDIEDRVISAAIRPAASAVDWAGSHIRLMADVRLVECSHDWDAWRNSETASPPAAATVAYLLYPSGWHVRSQRLGPVGQVLFSLLQRGASIDELCEELCDRHDAVQDSSARARVRAHVISQVAAAYEAGLVSVTAANDAASAGLGAVA